MTNLKYSKSIKQIYTNIYLSKKSYLLLKVRTCISLPVLVNIFASKLVELSSISSDGNRQTIERGRKHLTWQTIERGRKHNHHERSLHRLFSVCADYVRNDSLHNAYTILAYV